MKIYIKLLILIYTINISAQNEIFVQPITATKSYQGIFGSATIQIDDAGSDGLITNPLIVAEGLDTGLMAQAGNIGDTDITTFIRDVNDPNSFELEGLLTGGTNITFGDQDYDIIYVNWDNGTDFIQRNAFVLERVIEWVNEQKALAGSTEQNVVLGQSMGGLIARYALKDMEDNAENHDTSLYISHDAPHQGAHIPLGLLHMGRHIVNEFIQTPLGNISIPINGAGDFGLTTIDDLLDAPAVNQMLINNVDTNGNRTNTTHSAWQTELQTMGYPQQTRNIALSNASHCGNSQGLASNQGLVTVTGEGGTSVLTSIIELLFINIDPAVGIALNDVSAALLGFLPGNSSLDLEFRANTFPSSATARIYKGRLTYEKKFLWLIPITRTIFNKSVNSQFNDKFIDNYPGGISPNGLAIANNGGDTNWFYNYDYNIDVNLNFDFIPVTSALDVGSGNANLNDFDYYRQYTSANPPIGNRAIPFVNFTTSSNQNNNLNAEHISFNRRNGDWLAEELDADTDIDFFDCTAFCSNTEINGNTNLCTTRTYSVTNEATEVNWWISEGAELVTTTETGNQIILTANNSNQNNNVVLNVTYGNDRCGEVTISKNIKVGRPSYPNTEMTGDDYVYAGQYRNYSVPVAEGATSYYWYFDYGTVNDNIPPTGTWQIQSGQGTRNVYVKIGNINNLVVVVCRASNSCGNTIKYMYVTVGSTGGNGGNGGNNPCNDMLKVSSNPMKSDNLAGKVILVEDPCDDGLMRSSGTRNYTIEIFNQFSEKIYSKTQNNPSFNLNRLKRGFYIVKYQTKLGNILTEKILVE